MLSLDDEKAGQISEIIGSKTCKAILDLLTEKELTESEIASELKIPLNTIDYNVKKLVSSGLIEPKKFFWSVKGKKIPSYRISNKSIIISPKSNKVKTILPVVLISGLAALIVRQFTLPQTYDFAEKVMIESTAPLAASANFATSSLPLTQASPVFWFIGGCVFALGLFLILNWKRIK